jgi:hypothetical protein
MVFISTHFLPANPMYLSSPHCCPTRNCMPFSQFDGISFLAT